MMAGGGLLHQAYGAAVVPPMLGTDPRLPKFERLKKAMGVRTPYDIVKGPGNNAFHIGPSERYSRRTVEQANRALKSMGLEGMNPNPRAGRVFATRQSWPVAHELGHAKFQQRRLGRVLGATGVGRVRGIATMAGLGGAVLADPDSAASKASPWVVGASQVPLLAEEAAASIHGARGLRAAGAPRAVRNAFKLRMLGAYGTYAGAAALPVAAAVMARRIRKKGKERRMQRMGIKRDASIWAEIGKGAAGGAAGFFGGLAAQRLYEGNRGEFRKVEREAVRATKPHVRRLTRKVRKQIREAGERRFDAPPWPGDDPRFPQQRAPTSNPRVRAPRRFPVGAGIAAAAIPVAGLAAYGVHRLHRRRKQHREERERYLAMQARGRENQAAFKRANPGLDAAMDRAYQQEMARSGNKIAAKEAANRIYQRHAGDSAEGSVEKPRGSRRKIGNLWVEPAVGAAIVGGAAAEGVRSGRQWGRSQLEHPLEHRARARQQRRMKAGLYREPRRIRGASGSRMTKGKGIPAHQVAERYRQMHGRNFVRGFGKMGGQLNTFLSLPVAVGVMGAMAMGRGLANRNNRKGHAPNNPGKPMQAYVPGRRRVVRDSMWPEEPSPQHGTRGRFGAGAVAAGAVGGGAIGAAHTTRQLARGRQLGSLERAVGARRFVHGTASAHVPSIMARGLEARPQNLFNEPGAYVARNSPSGLGTAKRYAAMHERNAAMDRVRPRGLFGRQQRLVSERLAAAANAGPGSVVHGIMPHDRFHAQFRPDPLQGRMSYRSPTTIDPSALRRSAAGASDIVANRAVNPGRYILKHPRRFLSGAGRLAAPALALAAAGGTAAGVARLARRHRRRDGRRVDFNRNQPRDQDGKFTSGGGLTHRGGGGGQRQAYENAWGKGPLAKYQGQVMTREQGAKLGIPYGKPASDVARSVGVAIDPVTGVVAPADVVKPGAKPRQPRLQGSRSAVQQEQQRRGMGAVIGSAVGGAAGIGASILSRGRLSPGATGTVGGLAGGLAGHSIAGLGGRQRVARRSSPLRRARSVITAQGPNMGRHGRSSPFRDPPGRLVNQGLADIYAKGRAATKRDATTGEYAAGGAAGTLGAAALHSQFIPQGAANSRRVGRRLRRAARRAQRAQGRAQTWGRVRRLARNRLAALGAGAITGIGVVHGLSTAARKRAPAPPLTMPTSANTRQQGPQQVTLAPETLERLRYLHGYPGSMELREYGQAMGGIV